MKTRNSKSTTGRQRLPDAACSAVLAGIQEKLLAAAAEWDKARLHWRNLGCPATAAVCNTAALEFRDLARQCQPNEQSPATSLNQKGQNNE